MLIPYVTVLVRRDAMIDSSMSVMAHEVEVLRQVHGEEAVRIVPNDTTMGGRLNREIKDPSEEWFRLVKRYGLNPDTNVEFIAQAYGTVRQFAAALAEAADVEVELVEEPDLGDAADAEVSDGVSEAEAQAALDAERQAHGAIKVDTSELDALKAQNAELLARLDRLEAAASLDEASDEASDEGETNDNPVVVLTPVAKMKKGDVIAELEAIGTEHDAKAPVDALRALLAEVRSAQAPAA